MYSGGLKLPKYPRGSKSVQVPATFVVAPRFGCGLPEVCRARLPRLHRVVPGVT